MTGEHALVGVMRMRTTSGTGEHAHHRATLTQAGVSVGYWRCDLGTAHPLSACPDDPDPVERLIIKASRSTTPIPESVVPPSGEKPCPRNHDPDRMRIYWTSRPDRVGRTRTRQCLACAAERDRRRRAA